VVAESSEPSAPPPMAMEEAQERAVAASAEVAERRADRASAERDLERALRDPLATRLERIEAEHAVAAAARALDAAVLDARIAAVQRFVAVLEAEDAVAAAHGAAEVAERQLAADRVRAEAGVLTDLDLTRAEQEAASAARAVSDADTTLSLAWAELAIVLGIPVGELEPHGLSPIDVTLPELPGIDQLQAQTAPHAGIAAAERALQVARIRLAGGAHEGTPPNVLAGLEADVEHAERRVADVRASAALAVRSSYQSAVQAYARCAEAMANEVTAETTYAAQVVRFEAGELAPLALRQAELDRERAAATRRAALHAAVVAWYRLQQVQAGS
jgi:outer membrane protein TolC